MMNKTLTKYALNLASARYLFL